MARTVTVRSLLEAHRASLALTWVTGEPGADRPLAPLAEEPTALAGYLNLIHPPQAQVIGDRELAYLDQLDPAARALDIRELVEQRPLFVLLADANAAPADLEAAAERGGVPLLSSALPGQQLIDRLSHYLSQLLAERLIVHGVFMEVLGIGVLLTGDSGIGKSELALELMNRGHRLIADDAPEFVRVAPDTLSGSCPEPLNDFLEVRGLGVLNVRALFGDSATRRNKFLRLIVHLAKLDDAALRDVDRLHGIHRTRQLLDVDFPEVTLPVAPGRNLAILVEAAVRNQILKMNGYDAGTDFMERQLRHMEQPST